MGARMMQCNTWYVICNTLYIYMLCRYIIYNTAEVYPMFIYFVYVNSTSTIRRRSWSCHRRPGAADNSSCRPKLKLSGFQDLPELFSKVYSPVSTCIIHLYNIYIYICVERERDRERKIWKLKWNQATIQHSRGAKHPATRPGIEPSRRGPEYSPPQPWQRQERSWSLPIRSSWQKMPC